MVVAHPRDHDGELLIRHLQRLGGRVDSLWPPSAQLDRDVDVLLCLVDASARALLDDWDNTLRHFVKVMPRDYARALKQLEAERLEAASVAAE